jgi:hypothetical protein
MLYMLCPAEPAGGGNRGAAYQDGVGGVGAGGTRTGNQVGEEVEQISHAWGFLCQRAGPGSDQPHQVGIWAELRVRGIEVDRFRHCLRHDHAIERVTMVRREIGGRGGGAPTDQ